MNKKCLAASLLALTLALVACKDDSAPNYSGMGQDNSASLPENGGGDKIDTNGISENGRPPGDPGKYDYTTLASDTVYFAFDSSTVPAAERTKLNEVATWFKNNPGHSLFLAGHADVRAHPNTIALSANAVPSRYVNIWRVWAFLPHRSSPTATVRTVPLCRAIRKKPTPATAASRSA